MLYLLLFAYAYFLLTNLGAFAAIGWDKTCARTKRRRVPESVLLVLAALGGWLGAKAGQKLFHHKTHKESFVGILNAIPLLHLAMVTGAIWAMAAITV